MIKALIVDDEESGEQLLSKLLTRKHPEITLLPPADSLNEAVNSINQNQPDLVFLDIRLGNDSGFEVLEKTTYKSFHVIFVSAYSQYALKAIKNSAIDYLLKPVDMDDLKTAIERFKSRGSHINPGQLSMIKKSLNMSESNSKLTVPVREGYEFLKTSDVLYITADENYSNIHLAGGSAKLASKTLGYFEDKLEGENFFRIHKSYLINLQEIVAYEHGNGGFVKMADGKRLEVSRRKKKELLDRMTNF
ncbi:MAG: response regulator transcription factor [Roseivirga sp.]|nr:response regulator transcription factor [Roseivirga sp.]